MVRLVVGDDNIRNESLKARPHKLMLIMLNFINAILNSGIVPELHHIQHGVGLMMLLYKNIHILIRMIIYRERHHTFKLYG